MKSEVLSVKEKIGYGMGDAASHIIFDNVMLYMMFFYTDIFGIPAGFVGTMFLVARALDAISGNDSNLLIVFYVQIMPDDFVGNDSNLLIVFYVQIMPDDFVMQLHRF